MTDEEFEEAWKQVKAREKREEAEWDALPPDEKKRRRAMYDDGFAERISADTMGWTDCDLTDYEESDEED